MIGIISLTAVAIGNAVLWLLARPAAEPAGRFVGEVCGAEAVLLLSCSLVLATVFPPIERACDYSGLCGVAGRDSWPRRPAAAPWSSVICAGLLAGLMIAFF